MLGFAGVPRVRVQCHHSPPAQPASTGPWASGAEQDGKVLCISSPALQPQRSDWSGKELGGSFVKQTEMEREMGGYL